MSFSQISELTNQFSDELSNSFQPSVYQNFKGNDIKFFNEQVHSLNKIIENSVKVQKRIGEYLEARNCYKKKSTASQKKKQTDYEANKQNQVHDSQSSKKQTLAEKLYEQIRDKQKLLIQLFVHFGLIDKPALDSLGYSPNSEDFSCFKEILDTSLKRFSLIKFLKNNQHTIHRGSASQNKSKELSLASSQNQAKINCFQDILKDFPKLQMNITLDVDCSSSKKCNEGKSVKKQLQKFQSYQNYIPYISLQKFPQNGQKELKQQSSRSLKVVDQGPDISFIVQSPQLIDQSFQRRLKSMNYQRKLFRKQSSIIQEVEEPESSASNCSSPVSQKPNSKGAQINEKHDTPNLFTSKLNLKNRVFPFNFPAETLDKGNLAVSQSVPSVFFSYQSGAKKEIAQQDYQSSFEKMKKNQIIMQRMLQGVPVIKSEQGKYKRRVQRGKIVQGSFPFKDLLEKQNDPNLANRLC